MNSSRNLVLHAKPPAGELRGVWSDDGTVAAFRGVPYARPPVGDLRWRPPESLPGWSGVRDAHAFGPRCIQFDRDRASISYFGPEEQSEDCLTLNIWTAANDPDERRAVLVWFHGGGWAVGSGSLPIFDGEALAKRGAVVVTVNYRIGVLGFLAHPELSAESSVGACGNYGILDQIAALRWIRDNIAAFGGDPGCVTIFGQSAGSASVNILMASPLSRGLFHRAIAQSGGLMGPLGKPGGGSMLDRAEAEKCGLRYGDRLGTKSIVAMREMPSERVQLSWPAELGRPPVPILDGLVLREEIYDTYRAGRQADVPLISGSNATEGSTLPMPADWPALNRYLGAEYGPFAPMVIDCYGTEGEPDEIGRRIRGQVTFNWQNWMQACEHTRSASSKVYAYYFEHKPPLPSDLVCFENTPERLGTFHTAEIPYVFGTLQKRQWPWRPVDYELSDAMSAYWLNFAKTGNPNGAGLPNWASFDRTTENIQIFGETIRVGAHPLRMEIAMWDDCMARVRAARQQQNEVPGGVSAANA